MRRTRMRDTVTQPRCQAARKHGDTAREDPHRTRRTLTAEHARSGPLLAMSTACRAAQSLSNAVSLDCAPRLHTSNGAQQPPPGHKAAGKSCTEPRGVRFGTALLADVPPRVLCPESAAGRGGGSGDQAPAY